MVVDKVSRIEAMVDLPDDELPQCSPDERWQTPNEICCDEDRTQDGTTCE